MRAADARRDASASAAMRRRMPRARRRRRYATLRYAENISRAVDAAAPRRLCFFAERAAERRYALLARRAHQPDVFSHDVPREQRDLF